MKIIFSSILVLSIFFNGLSQSVPNQNNIEVSLVSYSKSLFSSIKNKNYSQYLGLVAQKSDFEKMYTFDNSVQKISDEALRELILKYKTSFDAIIKKLEEKGILLNNIQFKDLDFQLVKKGAFYYSNIIIHTDFHGVDYPILCDQIIKTDMNTWKQFGGLEVDNSSTIDSIVFEGEKSELDILLTNEDLQNEFSKFAFNIYSANWEKAKDSILQNLSESSNFKTTYDYLNSLFVNWIINESNIGIKHHIKNVNSLILEKSYKAGDLDYLIVSTVLKDGAKLSLKILVVKENGKFKFSTLFG